MERELKKAALFTKTTKEKISFGLIKVNSPEEMSLQLKIDSYPSLIAIKEGLEPMIYNSTLDYLQFVKFMR